MGKSKKKKPLSNIEKITIILLTLEIIKVILEIAQTLLNS